MRCAHSALRIILLIIAYCIQAQASQFVRLSCKRGHEERCQQIVDVFETALIADDANIFALRDVFFPSREHPPNSFSIHYHIFLSHYKNSTSRRLILIDEIVDWCKSSVSLQASPLMMKTLFSGLVYMTFFSLNSHHRYRKSSCVVNLNISDKSIPRGIGGREIRYAVGYLTPWVSLS